METTKKNIDPRVEEIKALLDRVRQSQRSVQRAELSDKFLEGFHTGEAAALEKVLDILTAVEERK